MDPTAIALAMGLQQAQTATPAAASASTTASLLDRCENQPLFRIEGEPVRMDLTAGAWIARLRGNASYGPISTVQQDVNTAYGLDTMEGAFQGDLSLMWKNWTVRATGSEFGTSATQSAVGAGAFGNTTYALGDTLSSSFDFYSWGIDVQSWVWRPLSKQQFPWEAPVANESLGGDLQVLAIVGGRGFGVNQQVQNVSTGAGSTYDNTFGTVIVGGGIDVMVDLRERLRWMDRLEFVVSGTWGPAWPGDGCTETEVRAQLTAWITGNVGVLFGYRYTNLELTQGDYTFSGNIAGLMVGASVRF